MKKICIIFSCVVLGIMTSSCLRIEDERNAAYYDALRACEPLNETHYLSWFTYYDGKRLESVIPYITENKKNRASELIEAKSCGIEFKDTVLHQIYAGESYNGKHTVRSIVYEYDIIFNNIKTSYRFDTEEHSCSCGEFPVLEPKFELIDCQITESDFFEDNKLGYAITEINLLLRVTQGDKTLEVPKTVLIKEYLDPIDFDVTVDDWNSQDVDVGI